MGGVDTEVGRGVRIARRVSRIGSENAFRIGPYIREVEESGQRVIRCNLGEPDFPCPPHVREEVKHQLDRDNTHYTDPQGIFALRRAIATHISETRGIEATPERVVVFPGAKPPIGLSQEAYTDPGDEVIYPSPGFPIYESFTRYVDAIPVPLHLRENKGFSFDGGDLAPLISDRTRLIFLNFPSNPTGGVADADQLADLADVIRRRAPEPVRVYSDEIYEDIVFDGALHRSIASVPGMAQRTIIVSGVSKSYSWTGGRIGWALFPTETEAAVFKNLNINYFSCVSPYTQEGAREALESPKSRGAVATMVAAFQERRDVVVELLNSIDGVTCQTPRGAFYVFPNISAACERLGALEAYEALDEAARARTSPATLVQMFLLFRYLVATMDRRSFGQIGSEGQHYLRVSIATGLDDLREALRRISRAFQDRKGFLDFVSEGTRLF